MSFVIIVSELHVPSNRRALLLNDSLESTLLSYDLRVLTESTRNGAVRVPVGIRVLVCHVIHLLNDVLFLGIEMGVCGNDSLVKFIDVQYYTMAGHV